MIVSVEKLICDGCGYEGIECGEITDEMIKENGWAIIDGKHYCEDCLKRFFYYKQTNKLKKG